MTDRNRKFWNSEVETRSEKKVREIQVQKIRQQIARCYAAPGYYRDKFKELGIVPDDIATWEDFRRLPILLTPDGYKQQQVDSLAEDGHPYGKILTCPLEKVVGVASTSGTTGQPSFYAYSRHDIAVSNEVLTRAFWRVGIRPGETVLHGFGLSMWVAGISMVRALEFMGARPIPVGADGGTERLLLYARLTKPSTLFCTPSFAEYLIERVPELTGMQVGDLGIKRIFCAGEPGAGLPAVRRKLKDAWGASIYDFNGGPWGISNVSCEHEEYQGMHLLGEDCSLHYDMVDPETRKPIDIVNGAIGAAVLTAFDWEAAPPIKYMNNDLMQAFTEPCPCGMPGKRRKVMGRIDDLLIVNGINVYPAAVKNIVNGYVPRVTGELRIVLTEPPPRAASPLRIKIERGSDTDPNALDGLKNEITSKLRDLLQFSPAIEFVDPKSLSRSMLKGKMFEKRYEQTAAR